MFFSFPGQERIFENVKGKILQHIGTFLFHILCLENIHGTLEQYTAVCACYLIFIYEVQLIVFLPNFVGLGHTV